MKCKALKKDHKQCKAYALRKGRYCFRHAQQTQKEALRASSSGGKANRQYHQMGGQMKISTPADIKLLMEKAINALWTGKMPAPNPAGSLGYLAKVFLEAHDKSELEKRLELLETKLEKLSI